MKPLIALALAAMVVGLAAPQPVEARSKSFIKLMRSNDKPKPRPPRVRIVDPMKALRMRMIEGDASYAELQQLADSGDDLGAYYLAKRIEETGDPEELGTAGYYYLVALRAGRMAAVRPLIRLLAVGALAEQPKNTAEAEQLLVKLAAGGDAIARDGLIAMYRNGVPFGAQPQRADELLVAAAEGGDTKAAFDLAVSLLGGTPEPEARERAKALLQIAATSDTLSIQTMAENMLRYLDPQLTASTETAL